MNKKAEKYLLACYARTFKMWPFLGEFFHTVRNTTLHVIFPCKKEREDWWCDNPEFHEDFLSLLHFKDIFFIFSIVLQRCQIACLEEFFHLSLVNHWRNTFSGILELANLVSLFEFVSNLLPSKTISLHAWLISLHACFLAW